MAPSPPTRTEDDELIDTIANTLTTLATEIRNGPTPVLPEEEIRRVDTDTDPVRETKGTAYGDQLHDLFDWASGLRADLQCETKFETSNNLYWSEDLLTPDEEWHPNTQDYDHASVGYRLLDTRPYRDDGASGAPLFELTIDYYTTGDIRFGLCLTSGYEVKDSTTGGDRLAKTFVYEGALAEFNPHPVQETINDMRPFVVSRVNELAGRQDVPLSQARAVALDEAGLSTAEIADRLDVGSESTVRSYKSKFAQGTRRAERRVITQAGVGATHILASYMFDRTNYAAERWYATHSPHHDATGGAYAVVRVQEDHREGPGVTVRTERFDSLAALIRGTYTQAGFTDEYRAEEVHDFIAELPAAKREAAGYETLPNPRDRLDEQVP